MKRHIKINFVDFYSGFNKHSNDFLATLQRKYDVEISETPDYLFYSGFGYEHLKYNCIRIFFTGECYTPNFNECDYAIAFDRLSLGDRYLRIPLYNIFQYKKEYDTLLHRPLFKKDDLKAKKGFCSFVVSNCFADDVRSVFFDKLSAYKKVASGGRYRNNIGGAIANKKLFQSKYKFAIAFENTSYDGYCTEKLMEAFAAGAVPIYWGDPNVAKDFNPASFINAHDFNTLDEVVERVRLIDNDDELYLKMRNASPLHSQSTENGLAEFLFHIIDQKYENAFRRPDSIPARDDAAFKLRHAFFESKIFCYYKKVCNQIKRYQTGTLLSRKRNK
jgi:alpha(1,3/1,4) fucosyltransferase